MRWRFKLNGVSSGHLQTHTIDYMSYSRIYILYIYSFCWKKDFLPYKNIVNRFKSY